MWSVVYIIWRKTLTAGFPMASWILHIDFIYIFLYIYICIQIYRFVLAEYILENKFLENPHIKVGGVLLGKEIGLWEIGERNS